jgi:para-nitrobenzyl esterase
MTIRERLAVARAGARPRRGFAGLGILALALAVDCGTVTPAAAAFSTDVVETTSGPVRGVAGFTVNKFLGIRYAVSPAAPNRWLPPQAPTRSTSVIDATTPGSACPQVPSQFAVPSTDEDCLFLNVWTPAFADRDERLPVMVWIHGGALVQGTGASYDPSVMVETGQVIVVAINYRLGALGWLADAALADAGGNSGNYGLMDQQLAMAWVRDNIGRFGGDPHRVTIFGESAGGLSTLANLASPTAKGLFHRAIVQSGAYMLFTVPPLASQETKGAAFATAAGCTGGNAQIAACLRKAPVATILAQQGIIGTAPTAGVPALPLGLVQAFLSGAFNQVPVIDGGNHDEGRLFEPFFFDPTFTFVPHGPAQASIDANLQTYPQEVTFFTGAALGIPAAATTALAALYPPGNFPNPDDGNNPSADQALSQIFSDVLFTCNALTADQLLAKFVPVYAYEFSDPNAPDLFQPLIGFSYGASHAAELQYLFDAATLQGPADAAATAASPAPGAAVQPPPLAPGGRRLAREMKAYWTNFAHHGTPNPDDFDFDREADDSAFWPLFDPKTGDIQSLVPGPMRPHPIFTFAADHNCTALAKLGL